MAPVLVVEEDDGIRQLLTDLLTEVGYTVDARPSPAEALAVLAERGASGVALVVARPIFGPRHEPYLWLDRMRAATAVPIVITTRYPRAWYADYAERGYAGLLTEPFHLPELVALVQTLAPLPD